MGRLTYKNQDGTWGLNNGYDIKKVPKELYGALCKLKDYEETGLEPDKAAEFDSMYLEKCKEINELKKQVATLQEAAGKLKDDFIERFIYKAVCEGCSGCCNCYENDGRYECEDYKEYMKIAEQLKEGRKSE